MKCSTLSYSTLFNLSSRPWYYAKLKAPEDKQATQEINKSGTKQRLSPSASTSKQQVIAELKETDSSLSVEGRLETVIVLLKAFAL